MAVVAPAPQPELVVPAHPMKDHIEGATVLKHVQPEKDASAPRIERMLNLFRHFF